jgi:hypothetical protein
MGDAIALVMVAPRFTFVSEISAIAVGTRSIVKLYPSTLTPFVRSPVIVVLFAAAPHVEPVAFHFM